MAAEGQPIAPPGADGGDGAPSQAVEDTNIVGRDSKCQTEPLFVSARGQQGEADAGQACTAINRDGASSSMISDRPNVQLISPDDGEADIGETCNPTQTQSPFRALSSETNCSDPPISNYPSYDDEDDAESESMASDASQHRARRRQLKHLAAQSDDCWDTHLSDEEDNKLPTRMQQQTSGADGNKPAKGGTNMQPIHTGSNGSQRIPEESHLSLPEQLLERRLRKKERVHRRHEQFARYQHAREMRERGERQIKDGTTSPESANKSGTLHLSGTKGDVRAASPLFPDDDFDDENASTIASSNGASSHSPQHFISTNNSYDHSEKGQSPAKPPLLSLPQRAIRPFPDESDRKRIVGCLAAVLASSYAYETAPHLLVKERGKMGGGTPIADDATKQGNDVDPAVVEDALFGEGDEPDRTPSATSSDGPFFGRNSNGELTAEAKPDRTGDDGNNAAGHPPLQPHTKQQHLIQRQTRDLQRQRSSSFAASFQKNRSHSSSDLLPKRSVASNPMVSLQQSLSFASYNNPLAGSQNPPPTLATELAEIRHRIRRHRILSELLVNSAEMLMLDPSHAKAFLPMLEPLLTRVEAPATPGAMDKSNHSANSDRQSWKGRGFGGGGMPSPGTTDGKVEASSAQSTNTSTSLRREQSAPSSSATSPVSERAPLEPVSEKPSRDDLSQVAEMDSPGAGELYEPFPSKDPSPVEEYQPIGFRDLPVPPPYAPLDTAIVERDLIAPFLQTLTPGAGFRCIALLLLNHLLRDGRGYDARVRQAFKRLAVIVLSHELKVGGILRVDLDDEDDLDAMLWGEGGTRQKSLQDDDEGFEDADELARLATRKYEAMEHAIAAKLISMSGKAPQQEPGSRPSESKSNRQKKYSKSAPPASSPSSSSHGRIALAPKETPISSQHGLSKEQILRGLKVGGAGALGATLFALTGGLAAPGIAAGLAAVAGGSAIAAGVTTALSSVAAITTIFGVGGAGLASYKMHRRTKGLTEFDFHKEAPGGKDTDAELFSTVCISGWLRDARDFQRPWGVSPSHPRIVEKQELLERFYFVHNPANVVRVGEILKHWKGRYFQLWKALREKYGRDPSNLFPLEEGPRISAELTHEEGEAVDFLIDELGYFPKQNKKIRAAGADNNSKGSAANVAQSLPPKSSPPSEAKRLQSAQNQLKDASLKPKKLLPDKFSVNTSDITSLFKESPINDNSTHATESTPTASSVTDSHPGPDAEQNPPPKHLLTVWDYHANYGGELYTVQWESELLMELCDSVTDQMIEWGISATKTILHTTIFATLMTAVTIPYSLVLAANAIDSSWTMAMERADRAGVELAKSLIDSTAGHRPVILAGFSMGARVIYSCLKELARHQEIWEAQQQKLQLPKSGRKHRSSKTGPERVASNNDLKYLREPASIVEDAILMGTPNHVSLKSWEACRRVVAGRLVNCYSRKDLILSLMFQMKRFQGILRPVCGTSPVTTNGVENYDVTDLVAAHTDYTLVTGEILKRIKHGQPQTASVREEVSALVTKINVGTKDIGSLASLSDEAAIGRHST
ncbi:hypothetical protein ACHAXT_002398 [Thalassiosira profunda]